MVKDQLRIGELNVCFVSYKEVMTRSRDQVRKNRRSSVGSILYKVGSTYEQRAVENREIGVGSALYKDVLVMMKDLLR